MPHLLVCVSEKPAVVTDSAQRPEVHGVVMHVGPDAESGLEDFLDFALFFNVLHDVLIISPCKNDFNFSPKKTPQGKWRPSPIVRDTPRLRSNSSIADHAPAIKPAEGAKKLRLLASLRYRFRCLSPVLLHPTMPAAQNTEQAEVGRHGVHV